MSKSTFTSGRVRRGEESKPSGMVIRQAQPGDVDDLYALARQTFFINLPADRDIIAGKIDQSQRSFERLARAQAISLRRRRARELDAQSRIDERAAMRAGSGLRAVTARSDLFVFVLEDRSQGSVIGTSQLIASMGGPEHPRLFMQLRELTRRSKSLKISKTHLVGRIEADTTGPTELGGLILNQAFRKHPARLGRFLSWIRFHFIGRYRSVFSDRLVAEMLGPIRAGHSPFFDGFTSKFVEGSFDEMYRFSQHTREFVTSLLPEGDVFISTMPPEVKLATGDVSEETRPARHMLESLGFSYHDRIDPLDGGPHLEAVTDSVSLVQATRSVNRLEAAGRSGAKPAPATAQATSSGKAGVKSSRFAPAIVSTLDDLGSFRAVMEPAQIVVGGGSGGGRSRQALVHVDRKLLTSLHAEAMVSAAITPLERPASVSGNRGRR